MHFTLTVCCDGGSGTVSGRFQSRLEDDSWWGLNSHSLLLATIPITSYMWKYWTSIPSHRKNWEWFPSRKLVVISRRGPLRANLFRSTNKNAQHRRGCNLISWYGNTVCTIANSTPFGESRTILFTAPLCCKQCLFRFDSQLERPVIENLVPNYGSCAKSESIE